MFNLNNFLHCQVFDRDGNGYIDSNELICILSNMGEHLTEEQVPSKFCRPY